MGIASVLAENERLRRELATRETSLVEREAAYAAAIAERDAKIAALQASNEDQAQRLELHRLKLAGRRNERHVEDNAIPLPFVFTDPPPPPRLPVPEGNEAEGDEAEGERPAPKPRGKPTRRDPSARTDRPFAACPAPSPLPLPVESAGDR